MNEVVIARFEENLKWIKDLPRDWRVTIYEKGMQCKGQVIENIGREPNTFLHHIVRNYHNLADTTAFLQGDPFGHCKDPLPALSVFKEGFVWVGDQVFNSDEEGRPTDYKLNMNLVISTFGIKQAYPVRFFAGGQFIVEKELILSTPLLVWEKALGLTKKDRNSWCFERLWEVLMRRGVGE